MTQHCEALLSNYNNQLLTNDEAYILTHQCFAENWACLDIIKFIVLKSTLRKIFARGLPK